MLPSFPVSQPFPNCRPCAPRGEQGEKQKVPGGHVHIIAAISDTPLLQPLSYPLTSAAACLTSEGTWQQLVTGRSSCSCRRRMWKSLTLLQWGVNPPGLGNCLLVNTTEIHLSWFALFWERNHGVCPSSWFQWENCSHPNNLMLFSALPLLLVFILCIDILKKKSQVRPLVQWSEIVHGLIIYSKHFSTFTFQLLFIGFP